MTEWSTPWHFMSILPWWLQGNAWGVFQYFLIDSHFLCPWRRGDPWFFLSFFWYSAQDTLALWKKHTQMHWMSHRLCPELKCDEEGRLLLPKPVRWFLLQYFCLGQQFCPLILLPMTTEPSGQGTKRFASALPLTGPLTEEATPTSESWIPIWTKCLGFFLLLQFRISLLGQGISFSTEQTISERLWIPYKYLQVTLLCAALFLNRQDSRVAKSLDPALEVQLCRYWLDFLGQTSLPPWIKWR